MFATGVDASWPWEVADGPPRNEREYRHAGKVMPVVGSAYSVALRASQTFRPLVNRSTDRMRIVLLLGFVDMVLLLYLLIIELHIFP